MGKIVSEFLNARRLRRKGGNEPVLVPPVNRENNRLLSWDSTLQPGWVPEDMRNDPHFTSRVMPGVPSGSAAMDRKPAKRRKHQSIEWMHAMIEEELHHRFFRNEQVRSLLPDIERQVAAQTLPAATAVKRIMEGL